MKNKSLLILRIPDLLIFLFSIYQLIAVIILTSRYHLFEQFNYGEITLFYLLHPILKSAVLFIAGALLLIRSKYSFYAILIYLVWYLIAIKVNNFGLVISDLIFIAAIFSYIVWLNRAGRLN